MHCTARGNIAHNFLRLKEGSIYSVKNFTMYANKDDFRLLRFAHFMLELDGDTVVRKSSVSSDGFDRYPFQFVEFDSLKPTNNKYLISEDHSTKERLKDPGFPPSKQQGSVCKSDALGSPR
ncbi:hypothetical protein Tco_1046975 [Tanacetum coccineum]